LLATGATPRKLPFAATASSTTARSTTYLALRRYAVPGRENRVVGGGFIGSEIAASLSAVGCQVTMLFPGASLGAGRFPAPLAKFVDGYYRERGVTSDAGRQGRRRQGRCGRG
jgi:NADPH-dependent 2,4-dienoyl-CoA reductase/sulfur reductase-like enzyme